MSRERLQEHFSDLYEGTLDPGLSQQLNLKFEADPVLKAEYDRFCDAMSLFETLKDEPVQIPQNLSSIIADRLESGTKKPVLGFQSMWKKLGFGALACVAIASAMFAINRSNMGSAVEAGIGLPSPSKEILDTVEIKMVKSEPVLLYKSSSPKTVTIITADDQKLVKKYEVNGDSLSCPLENKGELASAFQIEATGEKSKHFVIIPGSGKDYEAAGSGDIVTLCKLLATKYGKVIHLQISDTTKSNLKWDVSGEDLQKSAEAVLSTSEYTITTGADGILNIQNHQG